MKKLIFAIFTILPLFVLCGCQNNTSQQNNTTQISRASSVNNTSENTSNTATDAPKNNKPEDAPSENEEKKSEEKPQTETPLSSFSTQILTSSQNRLNNIQLACSELNNATVNNGDEFSFYGVVGPASESEGYKKADVIVNKKVIQATGGGMCQVSSTLYNVVLGIPNVEVTERHAHQKPVNYVEQGKDAAVSYGSQDFKFINNTGKTLKIYANADNGYVNINVVALE